MRYKDLVEKKIEDQKPISESDAGTTSACNVASVAMPFMAEPPKSDKKKKKQKVAVIKRTPPV